MDYPFLIKYRSNHAKYKYIVLGEEWVTMYDTQVKAYKLYSCQDKDVFFRPKDHVCLNLSELIKISDEEAVALMMGLDIE